MCADNGWENGTVDISCISLTEILSSCCREPDIHARLSRMFCMQTSFRPIQFGRWQTEWLLNSFALCVNFDDINCWFHMNPLVLHIGLLFDTLKVLRLRETERSGTPSRNRRLRTVLSYNFWVLNSRISNFSGDAFLMFLKNVATK